MSLGQVVRETVRRFDLPDDASVLNIRLTVPFSDGKRLWRPTRCTESVKFSGDQSPLYLVRLYGVVVVKSGADHATQRGKGEWVLQGPFTHGIDTPALNRVFGTVDDFPAPIEHLLLGPSGLWNLKYGTDGWYQ